LSWLPDIKTDRAAIRYDVQPVLLKRVLVMEIKINIDDIDYDSLAELMMPMLLDHMSSDNEDLMSRLMLLSQGFTASTVRAILSKMSQEKKDELLIRMINRNKPRIMQFITDMASSQGIRMTVNDVEAKK
jgi:hypothetical protein